MSRTASVRAGRALWGAIGVALTCVILVVLLMGFPNIWYPGNLCHPVDYVVWGFDYRKYDAMRKIRVGMTEQQVIELLGPPETIDREEWVLQTHGPPEQYGRRVANPNKTYWYSTGVDMQACIVLGQDGRVAYVNVGGT